MFKYFTTLTDLGSSSKGKISIFMAYTEFESVVFRELCFRGRLGQYDNYAV